MALSIFDLFKIGIGPSSSHTVGPMRAAGQFLDRLKRQRQFERCERVRISLYGSLALTGRGHGTDRALILGLQGEQPHRVDPDAIGPALDGVRASRRIALAGEKIVPFSELDDLVFRVDEVLPRHANGMRFEAFDNAGERLERRDYYSVGGGFVVNEDEAEEDRIVSDRSPLPYPFTSGDALLEVCATEGLTIAQVMLANETTWRSEAAVRAGLLEIHEAMKACMERGFRSEGVLPGGLGVARRAPRLYRELSTPRFHRRPGSQAASVDSLNVLDWVNLYALAVNEENAAGGRVVTAPTNGAAGIIPAVLQYYDDFVPGSNQDGIVEFLLTAGAIGKLYITNASISGAEVGCQGEVGVACSMAAGGLTAAMGGSARQVECAAEIGMEHNLGLTCDPVAGLVQIPCIERNAMAAVKAINAQRMASRGEGEHFVSLDKVIKTMRETGADMMAHYKETSRGGLAVNVIEC
ncbi:MAG: L-serine ammonia-lyase [Gammaproteobacteria bacterium]|nr:L-serine ammonia-lyase [Gammaproteobacteria bacterium]NNK33491.1 L-serine ammonia-lyase [Xanthomonadales bacterium]